MPAEPTLTDSLQALFDRTAAGIRPGLEVINTLVGSMDNPQFAFGVIHVAGTNGKGSVCAMLESMLRRTGIKTGLYTSPHLVDFRERIRVNGAFLDDKTLAAALDASLAADRVHQDQGGRGATFFELSTAMAFHGFRAAGVQLAVIETGMGGSWDATNVVNPLLSIITPISLDHGEYLGTTLEAVAKEKAGIIKTGAPVIWGGQPPQAASVLEQRAREVEAPVRILEQLVSVMRLHQDLDGQKLRIETSSRSLPSLRCPLLGRHQLINIALAVAGMECLSDILGVTWPEEVFTAGLRDVYWPARAEVVSRDPPVLLDGGHNPDAALAMRDLIDECAGGRKVALVTGILGDKDAAGYFAAWRGRIDRCWVVPVRSSRAADLESLRAAARQVVADVIAVDLETACREALEWARRENGLVCVTGSLYLAGQFMEQHLITGNNENGGK